MERPKVLIIDDKPANLLSLEALLASYTDEDGVGIEIFQAESGEKGLKILLEVKIDLILLDVQMPIMDGFETAKLIGLSKRTKSIPIIFLSAVYKDEIHMTRGYEDGAIDFISKPVNPALLKAKVGNLLKIQKATRQAAAAEKEKEAVLEATRLKSQFLLNMNHELRTPMNGILGMAELLLKTGHLNSEQKDFVETIKLSGEHMMRIVDDILDIARLEAQSLELTQEKFSLEETAQEVVNRYLYQIEKKQLLCEIKVDPIFSEPLIGDARRIKQMMINLFSNAVKFTEKGKVSLAISPSATSGNNLSALIEVRDTGIGVEESEKNHLFQLFSQVDSSNTKKYAGTGLGLVITKQLVELMRGQISWESEGGKGSVFRLMLPLVLADSQDKKTPPSEMKPKGKILIVDDNTVNQKVAVRMAKILGYDSDTALNGREGVEAFKREPDYSLILMDCLMPEMDGFEATRLIRQIAKKHIPIIAVTANSSTVDKDKCTIAGMDSLIAKPLRLDILEKEICRFERKYSHVIQG